MQVGIRRSILSGWMREIAESPATKGSHKKGDRGFEWHPYRCLRQSLAPYTLSKSDRLFRTAYTTYTNHYTRNAGSTCAKSCLQLGKTDSPSLPAGSELCAHTRQKLFRVLIWIEYINYCTKVT